MIVKTDKGKLINIETIKRTDTFYSYAYNLDGKKMGYASFKQLKPNEMWLYQVATYEEFRNNGVGSVLLDFVSYWSAMQNCNLIAGKFSPTSEHVEEFYHKNGFEILQEEYYFRLEKGISKEKETNNMKTKYKGEPSITKDATKEIKNIVESAQKTKPQSF